MDVTTEQVGTVCVARVSGRLDSGTADEFERRILDVAKAAGLRIVLDMGDVAYVSSAGLRVLIALLKQVKAGGGALMLAGVQPRVQDVFDISGFTAILPSAPTTSAALERLSPSR